MTSHPSKRQRRQVLSEEDYTNALSSIIRHDYFPDLNDLERQAAVQERRKAGDLKGAVLVRQAARRLQEREESLEQQEWIHETIDTTVGGLRTVPRPLQHESLTGFHTRVTSEDTAEFEKVQTRDLQQAKEERNRIYGARKQVAAQICDESERKHPLVASPLLLASDQFNPPRFSQQQPAQLLLPENSFFFQPQASTDTTALSLMPPPLPPTTTASIEYIPKHLTEKTIQPSNTRFPKQQPLVVAWRDHGFEESDISSSCDDSCTDVSTDLDASSPKCIHVERQQGIKRKARELETLVQMTPLIEPNASPIVTWGTVNMTPTALPSFSFPEESERDKAARKAQEKVQQRARKAQASLTPAAMSLLQKTKRPESARSGSAFASALRSSYGSSSRVLRDHAYLATPRPATRAASQTPVRKATTGSTDGLLQLPPR